MTTQNPLQDLTGLTPFDRIEPAHVAPAINDLIARHQSAIDNATSAKDTPTWSSFVEPLNDIGEKLSRAWGVVSHLHSVMDTPEWREAYNANLPAITSHFSSLGQNLALFSRFKALRDSSEFANLGVVRQRIINNELRDFRLSGAELPEDVKPRFKEIQEALAQLSAKFSENLLDATNAHAEWIESENDLAGIPEDVCIAAREAAQRDGKSGWKFTLQMPSYFPVMQYAENRGLRERLYRAHTTRASEIGKADHNTDNTQWNNTPLIAQILQLREEESKLLGYNNFAEVSLVPKMADTPAQVAAFLRDMAAKARPYAEKDLAELRAFAASELAMTDLQPWDIPFASEKLKQARYSFSDEEVKQYLPEDKVLAGLFRVIEALYGVRITADQAPVWHPDVRFFRIERNGQLVGQFYLDLYARETKRGGAWMDESITRRRIGNGIQTPVAYLVCNFSAPVAGKPALFTHDEVVTLFHETGHGLHHLLTQVEEIAVSGIRGVEWDAVELPSQFMENFCWEWDVLQSMTRHAETGATMPRALYDRMLAARNFQSGLQTLRQIEFSLFDLRLHSEFDPHGQRNYMQLLDEVRQEVAVLIPPAWNRFPNSFSHIFAGGYAAGYYSYKWAEVLSADAFEAFEEAGKATGSVLDAATGQRFMQEILAVGGSRPALESFKAFRGREPRVDALLRHSGMIAA